MGHDGQINILVIDDDRESLAVITEALAAPHCKVVSVASGTEALRQILKTDFALILLDVSMASTEGFEVATLIRQVKRSCHIPIIFLTARGDGSRPTFRGCGVGFVDYLAKPIDPAALQTMVAALSGACRNSLKSELGQVGDDLETVIRERTTRLIQVNEQLRREVARRESAEEQLRVALIEAEAATRAKSEFLANMSHEIRTPMNGIFGMMEIALQTQLTPEQREYISLARLSAAALLTVINDILDFSKIEAGGLEIESLPFSLRESIGDAMKALALDASRKGLELACDIAPELPDHLIGDAMRVRQIVTNLVGNAIKFTASGEVVLRLRRLPGREGAESVKGAESGAAEGGEVLCEFSVSDSGIGIPAGKLETIFAPFLQGDSSTTRLYGGTGLGLAIVARLVALMRGTIDVESEPGRGSTFRFRLPFHAVPPAPTFVAPAFPGLRVLVIEDHAPSRRSLTAPLRQWAVEVTEAADATSGLARIAEAGTAGGRRFDLVLLDDSLPGLDSYALAAAIQRGEHAGAGAVVVFGSALRRQGHAEQLDAAEFGSLIKPVKESELRAILAAVANPEGAVGNIRNLGVSAATAAAASAKVTAGPSRNILLVEDNPINCRLAERVLVNAGHRVTLADNGMAALAALAEEAKTGGFDLVLMDVQMPGMDGIETTRILREREAHSGGHVPIIALTAHAMAQHRERCLQAGMDAYLVKPIQPRELLAAIAEIAARQPAAQRTAPGTGAGSKVGAGDTPVVERASLLERIDGDRALFVEVTDMFLERCGPQLAEIGAALAARDAARFALLTHTLVGVFRSLSASAALAVAVEIEHLAEAGDWAGADAGFPRLGNEVERLAGELARMRSEPWPAWQA